MQAILLRLKTGGRGAYSRFQVDGTEIITVVGRKDAAVLVCGKKHLSLRQDNGPVARHQEFGILLSVGPRHVAEPAAAHHAHIKLRATVA